MEESHVRLEIIKTLIQSPRATNLRGDIDEHLIESAQSYVDYVLGQTKKAGKKKPVMVGKGRKPVESDKGNPPE